MLRTKCRKPRLPLLRCAIYQNDKLMDVAEQPDPRAEFVKSFNTMGKAIGLTAKPIVNGVPVADIDTKPFKVLLASTDDCREPIVVFEAATAQEAEGWLHTWHLDSSSVELRTARARRKAVARG